LLGFSSNAWSGLNPCFSISTVRAFWYQVIFSGFFFPSLRFSGEVFEVRAQ
jgi:hypothetical protein